MQKLQHWENVSRFPNALDFLKWNKVFYEATDGLFDPTVGPLIKLWDFLADEP